MTRPRVSDHALLRVLERVHGLDVEAMRAHVAESLARAADTTSAIGASTVRVRLDGYVYVIRSGTLATVLHDRPRGGGARGE